MSVSYGGDSITFADGSVQSGGWTGFRNRIINGAMRIDQRNAGGSVTINSSTNTFAVDRFLGFGEPTDGVFTLQQSAVAPEGFTNSLLATVTTADSSIGVSQRYFVRQAVEGFNCADFGWGTASASTVTLSFYIRSSLTGTFGGSFMNDNFDRAYPFTYTINAANTWERKSITLAGDTTGTWLKTNGGGIYVIFSIGAGSSRLGTAGAWQTPASALFGATGQTNIIATNGATWYITGVQLERGSTASSFEYRPYGSELQLCQRYCFIPTTIPMTGGSSSFIGNLQFPVTMRSAPSLDTSKLGTYKNSSAFGASPAATEYIISNFVSGNGVGFGVAPTSLAQTTQSAQVTYIYQNGGTTPSESTSVMNYVLNFGSSSRLILSAEL